MSRTELKGAVLDGVRWVTFGRIAAETLGFGGSVVVARLLPPAEFGYAALAIFFFALAGGLPSGSFGSPLVRASELRPAAVRTALTLSLLTGVLVSALVFASAPLLRGIFNDRTIVLLQLAAPVFLLFSGSAVSLALLQRRLDFRRLSIIEIVAVVPMTTVTIGGAALGWGGAAIVAGFLASCLTTMLLSVWLAPPGLPGFNRQEATHILRFGLPYSAAAVFYTSSRNIQLAILGARMAPAQVGLFWRASQLGIYYQGKVSGILLRILFPVLSRARTREDLHIVRARMVQVHTALLFPALALLVVLAPVLIPCLYGEEWAAAVVPTQILAGAGAATVVGTGTGSLMQAIGRPDVLMHYNLANLITFAAVVYFAAGYGLTEVSAAIVIQCVVLLLIQQYFLVQRIAGIPLKHTLTETWPAAAGCLGLAAAAYPVYLALGSIDAPAVVVLGATAAAGVIGYGLTVRRFFSETWGDVTTIIERVAPARLTRPRRDGRPPPFEVEV